MKPGERPFSERLARALPYIATAAVVIGVVNFFWFMAESLGPGDAFQGKIVEGHYFLGNKGTFTEVDQAAWQWSLVHGASMFVTHVVAMIGGAFLVLRRSFPAQMAGSAAADPELARRRIDLVRGSGGLLARESMGGRVGPVRMTAPLLEVSVYPIGLIIRAKLMSEHAILASEIVGIRERRSLLQNGLEIEHLGMGSRSPLVLYRAIDDPIVIAIRGMVADQARAVVPVVGRLPEPSPASPGLPSPLPNPAPEAEPQLVAGWTRGPANEPAMPGLEPRWLGTVLELLGLCVGLLLLGAGLLWAIPKLGGIGLLWTVAVSAILAWNGSRFVQRHFITSDSRPPADAHRDASSKR